jgi:hypothetical protein
MGFRIRFLSLIFLALLGGPPMEGRCQNPLLRGEASVSGVWSDAESAERQLLLRYLPEVSAGFALSPAARLDFNISGNLWTSHSSLADNGWASDEGAEPYRAWVRVSAPRFEVRAGLQKISFGSATIFRPLMWFDKVDPRDPLQLTEGVWGLLGRFYLPNNIAAWGWVLSAEEGTKGWELIPSLDGTAEAGGRVQTPLGPGEIAATYHHRRFDVAAFGAFPPGAFPQSGSEDRFALDGKWDLEVGIWVEAAFTRQDSEALREHWTHALSLGADYTFNLGNGLSVLAEYIVKENPAFQRGDLPEGEGSSQKNGLGEGPEGSKPRKLRLTSFTASYPYGILDRLALAIYRDWENARWYRLMEWRRTYDRWRIHLQAFWNPLDGSSFFSSSGDNAASSGSLAGRGLQMIVAFNH